ncbi:MAG TPA: alanine racemase, partial [Cyclobacteriaceae bacterium]|nr:alanine racemase [Cyclobacteriaceae bacterium]
MLDFRDIVKVTGGIVLQQENSDPVSFLVTDSRKAVYNPSSLFFAIRGRYHDGHDFIPALYNSGIRQFIVENNSLDFKSFPGSNFIYVPDSIHALQKITLFHRSRHKLKIIGITGSNGKTIVKEWLSQILSWKYNVVKSPKSFNSQIGVPLSVWQINENHEYGIFEAGISKAKEMEYLEKVLRPGMGIFTNIGTAHDEGFESTRQKILEKLKLFRSSELLIICSDQSEVHSLAKQELPDTRLLTWGYNNNSDIRVALQSDMAGRTRIQCRYNKRDHQFLFPYSDKASIENIMHCIALLLFLGWEESLIQEGINGLSKVSMRLELKKGINDCYIIDDTYNNDLVSLEIGLNFMANQGNKNNKTLILSDILQSGLNHKILYQKTAQLIDQYGVGKTIGIGTSVGYLGDLIKGSFKSYPDVSLFLKEFSPDTFKNEIILVKGARPYALEKIVTAFQEKIHGTVLEIDLDAVIHNFNYFRARLRPGVKIMIMVKALAYGNGMLEIANLMQYHLADYLGVAFADEGVFLRKNGIGIPVMVMNPTPDSFEKLIEFRLEPEIYSINLLHQLIPFVEKNNQVINIHLKLDTGMHRLGIGPETA